MHYRIFHGYAANIGPVKSGKEVADFLHFGVAIWIKFAFWGQPSDAGVAEICAWWVSDKQIPFCPVCRTASFYGVQRIPFYMVAEIAVFGIEEIAGEGGMAYGAKSATDNA